MVMGIPAKVARTLTQQEVDWKSQGSDEYVQLAKRSLETMREIEPLSEIQDERPRFSDSNHQVKD